jgi:hypothetical protein
MNGRWKSALTWFTLAAVLSILVGCSSSAPSEAEVGASGFATRESSREITASFYAIGQCRYTHVEVYVSDGAMKYDAGRPQGWSIATLNVFDADICSESGWDVLVAGWGVVELVGGAFTMTGNLDAARLRTTVDVHDWISGRALPVDIDLTWTGVGETWRWADGAIDDQGNVKLRYRSDGWGRSADVAGTVDLAGFDTVTPMPGSGWLARFTYATTTVFPKKPLPPSIEYFSGYPYEIYAGGVVALQWAVRGTEPIRLTIDQGVGDVTGRSYLEVAPTETTTYTLTASNQRGTVEAQHTVYVLPPLGPDGYEDNDVPARAVPIGEDEYGNLSFFDWDLTLTPGDVDWFTFTLDGPATIATSAWTHGGDVYLLRGLFDADVVAVDGYEPWHETSLGAGTYYLAITANPDHGFSGHHTRSTNYTLAVSSYRMPPDDQFEPNQEPLQATSIELPFASQTLTITPGDVDWFTFELAGPARIAATLTFSNTIWPPHRPVRRGPRARRGIQRLVGGDPGTRTLLRRPECGAGLRVDG